MTPPSLWALERSLSADERDRAERFHLPRHRRAFVAARGLLRAILGRYLRTAPSGLQFSSGPHGKPALVAAPGSGWLRFNLSHAGDLALYAVARDREVGVDLEDLRRNVPALRIAEQFFSAREAAALQALPPEGVAAAFLSCWTRKEAYLKALGAGLTLPLDQVEVSVDPADPAPLLLAPPGPDRVTWSLRTVYPGPGYVAALAVPGQLGQLSLWQWPGS